MHFAKIFALAAAFSGVLAAPAPMPQDGTVNIAGNRNGGNGNGRTTTTTRAATTTARPTTTTTTRTTTTTTPTPTKTPLPKCKGGRLTFNIKARSLDNPVRTNFNGLFVVDVGGPAGFRTTPNSEYTLSESFLTLTDGSGKIATVKTTVPGLPHVGDIVFVEPSASIANNWSPLRCTGAFDNKLACVANQNNRKVLQVCGDFINMDPVRNNNCQDEIAFDVIRTCEF